MAVQLKFNSMEDFEPGKIVQQVDPLRQLQETREKLRDLLTKVDRSEDLEGMLERVLKNPDDMAKLQADLGGKQGNGHLEPQRHADDQEGHRSHRQSDVEATRGHHARAGVSEARRDLARACTTW